MKKVQAVRKNMFTASNIFQFEHSYYAVITKITLKPFTIHTGCSFDRYLGRMKYSKSLRNCSVNLLKYALSAFAIYMKYLNTFQLFVR